MKRNTVQSVTHRNSPELANELLKQTRIGILLSGGSDSEVLLRAAADVLGPANTIAFHANTPFITAYYTAIVERTTKQLGIKLVHVALNPLQISEITANTAERCYHCKKAIYTTIKAVAGNHGITVLADGTNLDDTSEYRPGLQATKELAIIHPFLEAKMTKAAVRALGSQLNMTDPDRPSDSCLATRIPVDTPITGNQLTIVSNIEEPLRPNVKGRLRAKIFGKQIALEYQLIDNLLIDNSKDKLQAIADKAGYYLRFVGKL